MDNEKAGELIDAIDRLRRVTEDGLEALKEELAYIGAQLEMMRHPSDAVEGEDRRGVIVHVEGHVSTATE